MPPEDGFEAVELGELSPDSGGSPAGEPDIRIPELPETTTDLPGPVIDTGHAAEPVYQRLTRSRRRQWTPILAPLVCGGILVAAGVAYWWINRETMTGDLAAERLPPGTTRSAIIQRFVPDVPRETWQAALAALGEDPVIVESELMWVELRGARRGLEVSVSAGSDTDLVRVDVRRNRLLNQFCIDHAGDLDEPRMQELKEAATRFLEDWSTAAGAGMLIGNGRQYRDALGLNALTRGLGYHSAALVGNTLYPCVHEDRDGRLYFAIPRNVDEFIVTEREFRDRDSVFPGEYRFTVRIVAPPEEPAQGGPDEAMEGEADAGSEQS